MMETLVLPPESYTPRDIDILSDMIGDILEERYGVLTESLSFSIEVSFVAAPDEDE